MISDLLLHALGGALLAYVNSRRKRPAFRWGRIGKKEIQESEKKHPSIFYCVYGVVKSHFLHNSSLKRVSKLPTRVLLRYLDICTRDKIYITLHGRGDTCTRVEDKVPYMLT